MAVTRADVARLAGVSPAVVSYVINAGPRPVATATRARVEAAVAQLGYRPNAVARALRGSRTHSIGMLLPDLANPYFAELARAVEDLSFQNQYVLLVGSVSGDPLREASYLRSFLDRKVDGLLLLAVHADLDLSEVTAAGVPVVVLDRLGDGISASSVVVDDEGGAALGVRHLLGHGHRRIGCIAGPASVVAAQQRLQGWRRALLESGRSAPASLVWRAPFSLDGGAKAARTLLRSERPPSAVFVSTDVQGLGVLSACREAGIRVPEDLAIVSFDGTAAGRFATPPLTSVEQPLGLIARKAMEHLLEVARDTAVPAVHDVLGLTLAVRRSCGC